MIGRNKVLAVIPARGGSKGLPGKNIRPLGGKPMLAWSIEAAQNSQLVDRVVLSSDDPTIIEVARHWGCEAPFVRPTHLASDDTPTLDVLLHALDALPGYDIVVLLQPTSPLRTGADIDNAVRLMVEQKANACVSVTEPDKSPYWMYSLDARQRLVPLIDSGLNRCRRQDLPPIYVLNGAVYAAQVNWLRANGGFVGDDTIAYPMPRLRSLDVDYELDLKFIDLIIREKLHEQ